MGIKVQLALNTDAALVFWNDQPFDLVLSNLDRPIPVDHKFIPLKNCRAAFFSFPNDNTASEYHNNLAQFNETVNLKPFPGFEMAEALSERFPDTFGDTQRQRIIYYTGVSGGKSANACARIVTNRPDVLLQRVVSALAEFRWRKLQPAKP
jgi:hypothetical protein